MRNTGIRYNSKERILGTMLKDQGGNESIA